MNREIPLNYRDLSLLFGLALLIRLLAALPQQQPNYMDAAYSYVNAVNLAEGRGFVEDFVWNYLGNPEQPPHPSHLYWMPLTSILAWLGMAVGGISYRAAQIPFILLSALLAPISYGITYTWSSQRRLGWLAGLLAIFSGFYFPFWTAIDNFTPFAVAGALALLAAWRGMDQRRPEDKETSNRLDIAPSLQTPNTERKTQSPIWFLAAGALVGLAHLARADGLLLLIVIILVYALRTMHHTSYFTSHISGFMLYLILGYLLIMSPWFIRNWQVTGTLLPVTGSQTIWLTTYNDLFSYRQELSAQTFFDQGLKPVLQGRWWVLTTNLQTVVAVWGMIFLGPLAVIGFWQLRHHLLIQLVGLYACLLFVAMTLVFAFPGALGGLFHSGAALLPFICAAAMVGLDQAIDWVAARRRTWHAPLAKQVFGLGIVITALMLSSFIYYGRVLKNNSWNSADQLYPAIAAWITKEMPSATVMINNPPAYRYHGGGLSVVVPNENITTTLQVAHHYQVDYLILDHNHPDALNEVYTNRVTHPGLSLVQTYTDNVGHDVYIFKIK